METQIITTHAEFMGLEKNWNALLEENGNESVFFTFEWFKAWWEAFGNKKHIFILLLKDTSGKLIGIAPLMKYKSTCAMLPVKKISFMYNDNAAECGFIFSGDSDNAITKILDCLNEQKQGWDIMEFQSMAEDSANHKALKKILRKKKMRFCVKDWLHSPYISIDSDWTRFVSNRSRKLRKNLRNLLNRLNRKGTFSIQQVSDLNHSRDILNTVITISKTSWKTRYKKSIAYTSENRHFFESLCTLACKKNWLKIWMLKIRGEPVAYEYHLIYKNKAHALRADFNEKFKRVSPGAALNAVIIKSYFESGLKEYDLCGHAEDYKLNWTSTVRRHSIFVVYGKNRYGALLYFIDYVCGYWMKRFLKQFRVLKILKRKWLDRI
ncbi:MAG: GNAT family N-acetyltransferase [Candidatus Omnitrophica bacterium]|nr:GNAT family N-acetyltransferase [Candidatus Omnitrophota bacterium]